MIVTTEYLIDQVRSKSGLRSNQFFDDDKIADFLSDHYAALRDLLIARFAYWFKEVVTFTCTSTNNVFDLSTLPDFEMAQGVNLVLSADNKVSVDLLPSFEDRNNYNTNSWLLGVGPSWTGTYGLVYFINGSELEILPRANATGDYELIYTPMYSKLALPVTVEWELGGSATASDNGGFIRYEFGSEHPTFTDDMLGGTLAITVDAPDDNFSTTGTIITGPDPFGNGNVADTGEGWPGPVTLPPFIGTASITYQPADTLAALPPPLAPFQNFLVLGASIDIRNGRDQSTAALQVEFERVRARVTAIAKQRTQGVSQAPRVSWAGGGRYR